MKSIIVFCVAASLYLMAVNGQNCGSEWRGDVTGKIYNLAPLTRPKNSPWKFVQDYTYFWNFCVNLEGTPPELSRLAGPSPTIQVSYETGFAFTLGLLNGYQLSELENGVRLVYASDLNHNYCHGPNGPIARNVYINVICDVETEGSVLSLEEPSRCSYNITMTSKHACPVAAKPGLKCCLYSAPQSATKTLCTSDPACPNLVGFGFLGGWGVPSCGECSFAKLNNTTLKN